LLVGQEHGRTIPLAALCCETSVQCSTNRLIATA